MTDGLAALFARADSKEYPVFQQADLERWALPVEALPFIASATTPETVTCPGCHEACLKTIRKQDGQAFIWCDEAEDLGHIALEADDLKYWQLNMPVLARTLCSLLELGIAQEIIPRRAYDLGTRNGHTLFLVRGISWADSKYLSLDSQICNANPMLITLSEFPAELSLPGVWIGQLLRLHAGKLTANADRLAIALQRTSNPKQNIFRQQGTQWQVCYQGKEIFMPDSKGMAYVQYLLQRPNKEVAAIELQGLRNQQETIQTPKLNGAKDEILDGTAIQQLTARLSRLRTH